eukprot:4271410-Alexandrium_andersonii.AAC.1
MKSHEHLAIKPYPRKEELQAQLAAEYPGYDWQRHEHDWRERTVAKLELVSRLLRGESGMD